MLKKTNAGYILAVIATATVLIWIGIFKFTPVEAAGIKPLINNSFLIGWLYAIGSVQQVSNFIGIFEIVTGILLLISFWHATIGKISGYMTLIIFFTTLSFLFSTPGTWKIVQGVPVTDFFILKDLAYLAIGLQIIAKNSKEALV